MCHEDVLRLLESVELVGLGRLKHFVKNCLLEILILAEGFKISRLAVFFCPLFGSRLFDYHNCNTAILERVSVDHDLCDQRKEYVYVLELLGSNVLALAELEYIFGAINDFD